MNTQDFERGLKLLDQRFRGGRATPEDTAYVYYERLKHIPSEPFMKICEAMVDDMRSFPSPSDIKKGWYAYLERHPEKRARYDKTHCDLCFAASGVIFAKKHIEDLGAKYSFAFRCGDCQNWMGELGAGIPMLTVIQVEDLGYEVEEAAQWSKDTKTSLADLPQVKSVPQLPSPTHDDARKQIDDLKEYCDQKGLSFD